jgi:hypothetical protein
VRLGSRPSESSKERMNRPRKQVSHKWLEEIP